MLTPCHENSVGDFGRNSNDGVSTNSEVGHTFVRKQFISMDRPPLVIFMAKFQFMLPLFHVAYLMIYFFGGRPLYRELCTTVSHTYTHTYIIHTCIHTHMHSIDP